MNSNKLYQPARNFLEMYERVYGAPDEECKEYWDLKNAIDAIYKKSNSGKPKKKQCDRRKLLKDNIRLVQMLFSCWPTYYEQKNETCIIAKCKSPYNKFGPKEPIAVLIAFNDDGSIYKISFRPIIHAVERRDIIKLIKNPLIWA